MSRLKKYHNKEVQIFCSTEDEFRELIPDLNDIWRDWTMRAWEDNQDGGVYIFMDKDCCSKEPYPYYETIHASNILAKSQGTIINTYPLY